MTMPRYKSGESMMTVACYESGNDDDKSDNNDKFDNNEDKVCSLLKRWGWVGHVLDHVLDHMIIGLVITALYTNRRMQYAQYLHRQLLDSSSLKLGMDIVLRPWKKT